jgi:hypothetical protein
MDKGALDAARLAKWRDGRLAKKWSVSYHQAFDLPVDRSRER